MTDSEPYVGKLQLDGVRLVLQARYRGFRRSTDIGVSSEYTAPSISRTRFNERLAEYRSGGGVAAPTAPIVPRAPQHGDQGIRRATSPDLPTSCAAKFVRYTL